MIAQIVNGVAGPAIVGDDPLAARARLGQALLDADAARPDRLCRARARRDRHCAVGHQGQGAEGQPVWRLLGGARDRAAGLCHLRLRLLRPRAACRRGEALGQPGLQAAEDDGRQRGAAPPRHAAGHGCDPRRCGAGEGGARGGRARHRALRRRQLQSRSLPRHQARRDDQAARHRVLRGAADAERRACR